MPVDNKTDFLRECMSDVKNIPLDKFNLTYCRMCANRSCARSALNNSHFDLRARNWHKDLFTEVPRADDADSRYDNIRAKQFISIEKSYEIRSAPIEPITSTAQEIVSTDPPTMTQENIVEPVEMVEPVPAPKTVQKPVEVPRQPAPDTTNTPFTQGAMLHGVRPPEPTSVQQGTTFVFDED